MVPCHSCYVYVTWASRVVGKGRLLKSSYGGNLQMGRPIYTGDGGGGGLTSLDTMTNNQ